MKKRKLKRNIKEAAKEKRDPQNARFCKEVKEQCREKKRKIQDNAVSRK